MGTIMEITRSATTCRWATPTLSLAAPFWLDAWDRPWACTRDTAPRALDTTDVCASCPRWESQPDAQPAPR
jgi:hypothetical protein